MNMIFLPFGSSSMIKISTMHYSHPKWNGKSTMELQILEGKKPRKRLTTALTELISPISTDQEALCIHHGLVWIIEKNLTDSPPSKILQNKYSNLIATPWQMSLNWSFKL
ncbi:hypothetical protein ES332_D03G016100v1 [Gossypium tomentosum]|uniref:Uncharacterized protein n=1 Tax=Gossypium tomentosum TaxID=34277 RepID=A0A5D2LI07_GOSTO|nr:hypothetical protein ES332_D03G016100v1 [Gossypium tomentosum]